MRSRITSEYNRNQFFIKKARHTAQSQSGSRAANSAVSNMSVYQVAAFLSLIGKSEAINILNHLPQETANTIVSEMAQMKPIPAHEAQKVLARFHKAYNTQKGEGLIRVTDVDLPYGRKTEVAGKEVVQDIYTRLFGGEEAKRRLARVLPQEKRFGFLENADGQQLASLLHGESVVILAALMVHMPEKTAARLLDALDIAKRISVVKRIAKIQAMDTETLQHLEDSLKDKVTNVHAGKLEQINGKLRLADILRHMDVTLGKRILDNIGKRDITLAEHIRQSLISIEDLLYMEGNDLQLVLQRIDNITIAAMLKGKTERLIRCVYRNMGRGRAATIKIERETLGAMRKKDVESATDDVVKVMRNAALAGEVRVPSVNREHYYRAQTR